MSTALPVPILTVVPAPPRRATRGEIEAAIEAALDGVARLVAHLDILDGDPDLEPEEPETGAREWWGKGVQRFDVGAVA